MRSRLPLFALALLGATVSAAASGTYDGASSVAGGRSAVCAGVTPMRAVVSGSDIRLEGLVYEGSGETGTGTVKADGSFSAVEPSPKGDVVFSGRVSANRVEAQWKGPDCYGAIDLTK